MLMRGVAVKSVCWRIPRWAEDHGLPFNLELVLESAATRSIGVTFVAFDVLRVDGHDVMCNPWSERRALLEEPGVERWPTGGAV